MLENFNIASRLILEEATRRGIEVVPLDNSKLAKLNFKGHLELLFAQISSKTTSVANRICKNKAGTKIFISRAGISVAKGRLFDKNQFDEAVRYCNEESLWPIVFKPNSEEKGKGVTANIKNAHELAFAWKKIKFILSDEAIVEKYFEGTEYRLLATREKFLAATKRVPANVVGDGVSTISQLVEKKNSDPRRGKTGNGALEEIIIDSAARKTLLSQKMKINSIPQKNQQIFLRHNSNLSTGGDSIDFTDTIHDSVKEIAVAAVKAIPGLAYAGVDFMCKDITAEQKPSDYIIVEVNSSPGIDMHHFPYSGKPRNVAKDIVDVIFPETAGGKNV